MIEWFSSTFLSPLGALFGLSLPALILLYLLKLKRTRREVASVLLWRRSLEDLTANSPFQKLRSSPLLWLQLLLLALLTLAMMRPVFNLESVQGLDYYVVLDCSASMAATDVKPNRLAKAIGLIRNQIGNLGQGDRMMLVTFSDHSAVVVPLSENRGELLSGLDNVVVEETETSLTEALTNLRASIGDRSEQSRIYLYSDGCIPHSKDLFPPSVETVYVRIGDQGQNIGISRFSLSSSPTSEKEVQVFVELIREGTVSGTTSLSLEWEGNLVDAHRFEWKEKTTHTHVFQTHAFEGGLVTVSVDSPDDFPLDDRAGAYLSESRPIHVQLVAHGDTPFERALRLVPDTTVERVAPEGFSATSEADVVVFDSWSPSSLPPRPKGFFFAGTHMPENESMVWGEETKYPLVLDWKRTHPVMRGADYRNLQVARAYQVLIPEEAQVLLESRETPLLFAREQGERRVLVSTFSVLQSNWPRLYSFPITVANAVRWLAARTVGMEVARVLKTGLPIEISAEEGQDRVVVRNPAGEETSLELVPGQRRYYSMTYRTGTYDLVFSEKRTDKVWLNLLDSEESRITPREILSFGGEKISAVSTPRPRNQEVWSLLALMAFIVLMGEWWYYTKQSWM